MATNEVTLALKRFGTGTPLVIGVAGSKARTWSSARQAHVEFFPRSPVLIYRLFSSTLTDGRAYISLVPLPAAEESKRTASGKKMNEAELKAASEALTAAMRKERENELVGTEKIEGISLGKGFIEPLLVQTGSLRAPYEAMQKCLDDLLVSWKIDAVAHRSLKQYALPTNFDALSKSFFYPLQAMATLQSGLVRYRLIVDPTGNVTDCKILGPGGTTPLGRETCRTMLGTAKFTPAQDAAGNPLRSFYVGQVNFVL
jgi:TonB family protein